MDSPVLPPLAVIAIAELLSAICKEVRYFVVVTPDKPKLSIAVFRAVNTES